jgi:hypothetical protein
MTTAQRYLDIPKQERTRLVTEVIRLPKVRGLMIISVVIAVYGSAGIAKIFYPSLTSPLSRFIVEILITSILAAAFAFTLVRPLVRTEVIKAKELNQ